MTVGAQTARILFSVQSQQREEGVALEATTHMPQVLMAGAAAVLGMMALAVMRPA